jgi:hypothetical protein
MEWTVFGLLCGRDVTLSRQDEMRSLGHVGYSWCFRSFRILSHGLGAGELSSIREALGAGFKSGAYDVSPFPALVRCSWVHRHMRLIGVIAWDLPRY